MSKRGGKVPRPVKSDEWTPVFDNNKAGKAWAEIANTKTGANMLARFWDIVTKNPRWSGNPDRHHRMKTDLATGVHDGRTLEQWQHEISGGGRIWFLIDDDNKTVRIRLVSAGHPSKTD